MPVLKIYRDDLENWEPITVGGGDVEFNVDGVLAILVSASVPFLVTKNMVVQKWYIYCETPGSASSTIVDVNKNGTTVFTAQANRPTLAFDDVDGWASGVPDIQTYVEGDIISIDVDQVATDAARLTVIGVVTNSNGVGGHIIQDAGADQIQRAKLNFIGATVSDDSVGNATDVTITGGGGSASPALSVYLSNNFI